MAAKADRFYFENLSEASEYACKAADYLVECLSDYNPDNIKRMLETMHGYEHAADGLKHDMSSALAKAFVTPIDREDLALISQNVDDVTDCIEEVLQGLYMYKLTEITPEAVDFANKVANCCRLMKEMLSEFVNFKKPEKLHDLVVKLNRAEEECDAMYIDSTMLLGDRFESTLDIISWRDIYGRMENCADACEHVGECVDMVVMKNT